MLPKLSLLLLLFTTNLPFRHNSQAQTSKKLTADKAMKIVMTLPEVKDFFKHTPKDYKPELMLAAEPDSSSKYFWVKVGISNFDMFRTTYDFYVDPKTMRVRYWDQLDYNNSLITLEKWRCLRKTKSFNKMHVYKKGKLIVLK